MKSTELRIGNNLIDREGKVCRVERLECADDLDHGLVVATSIEGTQTSPPVEGIGLNEPIIKKLGFKDGDYPLYYELDDLHGEFFFSDGYLRYKVEFNQVIWQGLFVHELQNFVYAVSGIQICLKHKGPIEMTQNVLDSMKEISGIPSNQSFYDEFNSRLIALLNIKEK